MLHHLRDIPNDSARCHPKIGCRFPPNQALNLPVRNPPSPSQIEPFWFNLIAAGRKPPQSTPFTVSPTALRSCRLPQARQRQIGRMAKRMADAEDLTIAASLAKTGRYRNVTEVEAALRSRAPNARLDSKIIRQWVDAMYFRARRARGSTT